MKKALGLDLGTTSIGWALVNEAEIGVTANTNYYYSLQSLFFD